MLTIKDPQVHGARAGSKRGTTRGEVFPLC